GSTSARQPFRWRPNAVRHVLQRRLRNASGICTTLCRFPRLHSLAGGNGENVLRECPRWDTSESNRVGYPGLGARWGQRTVDAYQTASPPTPLPDRSRARDLEASSRLCPGGAWA